MDHPPLGRIRIAAPCKAEWKWMYGNDRVRFCGQCSQNVFNLSAMTTEEAEDLIRRSEGRLCVRFYRRQDGTILTRNCSAGLEAIKRKLTSTRAHVVAGLFSFLAYLGFLGAYKLVDHQLNTLNDGILKPHDRPSTGMPVLPPSASETFIRDRAVFEVVPILHADGSSRPTGDVVVHLEINEAGEVDQAWCEDKRPALRDLAERAARLWKFEPVLINGRPARVHSSLTFHFRD